MRALAALSFVALIDVAASQQLARERAFGLVRNRDGKPWVGAQVHLLHRAHPGVLDASCEDKVTATTDERGRFRVQLLPGMPYAVWARGAVEDGVYRCTPVLSNVVPGVPIVLDEAEPHYVRRVALELDASWKRPLSIVASCRVGATRLRKGVVRDELGFVTTPAWPAEYCVLELVEDEHRVSGVWVATNIARVQRYGDHRGATAIGDEAEALRALSAPVRYSVPGRHERELWFVDQKGRPVAGAQLRREGRPPRVALGTSDAEGRLRIVMAGDDPGLIPYRSVILAPGCAETRLERDLFTAMAAGEVKQLSLLPGTDVRGRLRLGEQTLANIALVLSGSIWTGGSTTWFGVDPRMLRSDAKGRFVVPGRLPTHPFRLSAVLPPALRAQLAAAPDGPPVWPMALIYPERPGEPKDLGDLDLRSLEALDMAVLAPDGAPPGSVRLLVVPLCEQARSLPHDPEVVLTDRHGRVRLLVAPGPPLLVHAISKRGAAWTVVKEGQHQVALRLDAQHAVRFRVVDGDGKPLAGVSVGLVAPDLPAQLDPLARRALRRIRDLCMIHAFPGKHGYTDAEGYVDLVMPAVDVSLDLSLDDNELGIDERLDIPFPAQRPDGPIELVVVPKR